MDILEAQFQAAVDIVDIAGAVIVGSDSKDKFYYAKSFGVRSLKQSHPVEPLLLDATFYYISSTKLLTSIAALQCVEAGLFTLDEDITRLMPEFKDAQILTGFNKEKGEPVFVKSVKTITLRRLLSHSSGLAYAAFHPLLRRWRMSRNENRYPYQRMLINPVTIPLIFEPGEKYSYGPGPEIAGMMVARASGMSLGEYMKKHIWDPLGITNMTFHLDQRPDLKKLMPEMSIRLGGGHPVSLAVLDPNGKLEWGTQYLFDIHAIQKDDEGGTGIFGSAVEFHKVLKSITTSDGILLGLEMCHELFKPQLSCEAQVHLGRINQKGAQSNGFAPNGPAISCSLGGLVTLANVDGGRQKGTMFGGGASNTFWWADREAGIWFAPSGFYGSNLLPTADPKSIALAKTFEAAMYARKKRLRSKL